MERFSDLFEMLASLKRQSYKNLEILLIVDGSELYKKITNHLQVLDEINITCFLNEKNYGLAYSRNIGVKRACGDVIAFIDDDTLADINWAQEIIWTYEKFGPIGVGGKLLPLWIGVKPDYFPEELYWIVGATHKGFSETEETKETRNTFGANMSFRREVFEKIGLFNEGFGLNKTLQMQAEETEFSVRAARQLRRKILYNPNAVVYHKVSQGKTSLRYILNRAFWQGYSKHYLNSIYRSNTLSTESKYLNHLMKFYLNSIKSFTLKPSKTLKQIFVVTAVIMVTGFGYIRGLIESI